MVSSKSLQSSFVSCGRRVWGVWKKSHDSQEQLDSRSAHKQAVMKFLELVKS